MHKPELNYSSVNYIQTRIIIQFTECKELLDESLAYCLQRIS